MKIEKLKKLVEKKIDRPELLRKSAKEAGFKILDQGHSMKIVLSLVAGFKAGELAYEIKLDEGMVLIIDAEKFEAISK